MSYRSTGQNTRLIKTQQISFFCFYLLFLRKILEAKASILTNNTWVISYGQDIITTSSEHEGQKKKKQKEKPNFENPVKGANLGELSPGQSRQKATQIIRKGKQNQLGLSSLQG